jgi:hypothetical protein
MWLFSRYGYVSIVAHTNKTEMMLRFRAKVDAQAHKKYAVTVLPKGKRRVKIHHTPKADYPFRFLIPVDVFPAFLAGLAATVDYPNFKSAVTPDLTTKRHRAYLNVWSATHRLSDADVDETHRGENRLYLPSQTRYETEELRAKTPDELDDIIASLDSVGSPTDFIRDTCPDCDGLGFTEDGPCKTCRGTGEVKEEV